MAWLLKNVSLYFQFMRNWSEIEVIRWSRYHFAQNNAKKTSFFFKYSTTFPKGFVFQIYVALNFKTNKKKKPFEIFISQFPPDQKQFTNFLFSFFFIAGKTIFILSEIWHSCIWTLVTCMYAISFNYLKKIKTINRSKRWRRCLFESNWFFRLIFQQWKCSTQDFTL